MRGCPHRCEFCAGSRLFGPGYRQKTVDQVLGEIRAVGEIWDRPFLEFADDNLFVDRRWGRELLERLRPLGVRWFAETDISIADDPDLVQALRPAGCYQLLIGLESLSHDNLAAIESTGWKAGRLDRYVHAVRTIQDAGVTVNTCFIVGLDGDTPAVFDDIRRFVRQAEPLEIQVTVLTPFPGTPLFERLRREGRLDQPPFWHKCTLFDVNYRPAGMSREQLRRGLYDLFRDLYNEEAFARPPAPVPGPDPQAARAGTSAELLPSRPDPRQGDRSMCYDMCLRALDDALQTFGSMRYRRVGRPAGQPGGRSGGGRAGRATPRDPLCARATMKVRTWTRRSSATPATCTITTTTRRPSGGARPAATATTTRPSGPPARTARAT